MFQNLSTRALNQGKKTTFWDYFEQRTQKICDKQTAARPRQPHFETKHGSIVAPNATLIKSQFDAGFLFPLHKQKIASDITRTRMGVGYAS